MIIQSTNVLSGTVLSGHPLLSGRCHHLRSRFLFSWPVLNGHTASIIFEVKRLIWSALEIELFELCFLQPVLGVHPVLTGHFAIPRVWPLNTGSTVLYIVRIFSSSELVEPHFNPVKVRLVALKEEAKWQVFVRDCEHWILLIYRSLIL